MATEDFKRKLTAILSADAVGYSRLMGDDEADTVKTLEAYKGMMFSLIRQHRGRVVDSPGDNLLAEFGSVVDAVQCGVSIQKELQARNANLPESRRMEFRIGINLGDVIEEQNRIYGDGVNIAARLEALADPGGICISKTAFDYIEKKLPFGYSFIGEQTVKNIAKPIGAYKVLMETRLIDEITNQESEATPFRRKKVAFFGGIIVALGIVAVLSWNFSLRKSSFESTFFKTDKETAITNVKKTPKSIAVLPFEDLSPEKDQEHFVDGLSEEILNSLTHIPGLSVKARTSSFSFKGHNRTVQEIAKVLGADHILEGSVRKDGNTIRITAQLINGNDESHLWSETYDKKLKVNEIFAIQEDIANNVADKLKLTLEAFHLLGGTENIEAYELYLNAQGIRSRPYDEKSLELLDSAILLDPDFALAYALKAEIHNAAILFGPSDRAIEELDKCKRAIDRALELEPDLAYGYMVLGGMRMFEGEWIEVENNFRKALELNDGSLSGDLWDIIPFNISVGKVKKAYELSEKIRKNDPLNQAIPVLQYVIYGIFDNRERAEEEYQNRINAIQSDSSTFDEAITIVRIGSGAPLLPEEIVSSNPIHIIGKTHLDSPEEGLMELRHIYTAEDSLSSYDLIRICLWASYFGDPEFALEALEKSTGISSSTVHCWYPVMKKVRLLPGFKKLVRKTGLVDYWKEYGWPDLCHPVGDDDFVCE